MRQSLKSAYSAIQQAKSVNASDQRVAQSRSALEDKYLAMIEASAEDRAYHRAQGFIDDSLAMDIDKERIELAKEKVGMDILKKARQFDRL